MTGRSAKGFACFQFLGIPPKGEQALVATWKEQVRAFPISRDPPEGGTFLDISP